MADGGNIPQDAPGLFTEIDPEALGQASDQEGNSSEGSDLEEKLLHGVSAFDSTCRLRRHLVIGMVAILFTHQFQ